VPLLNFVLQNLCEGKANSQGIRTARLPIGVFLSELPTRKVLTVNQVRVPLLHDRHNGAKSVNEVCDILLYWIATRDWKSAFHAVVPSRKFEMGKKAEKIRKRRERRITDLGREGNPDEGNSDVATKEEISGESDSNTDEESKQVSTHSRGF
jgi:hypothetical protein